MTSFEIPNSVLDGIKGASSGIGLATLRRVLKHGGKVFASDLNILPSPEASSVPFCKTDVTAWKSQLDMFKAAVTEYGHIDHVFANAGISMTSTFLEDDVDENGDPLPPKMDTVNVNFIGCLYTVKLGVHYLRKNPKGGSIVMTASKSSFTRFAPTDYTSSKHAVLGLLRALTPNLSPKLHIRINAIAPNWTETGIVSRDLIAAMGATNAQLPDAAARSALVCMADVNRHGELIYSEAGRFRELENGREGIHEAMKGLLGMSEEKGREDEGVLGRLMEIVEKVGRGET